MLLFITNPEKHYYNTSTYENRRIQEAKKRGYAKGFMGLTILDYAISELLFPATFASFADDAAKVTSKAAGMTDDVLKTKYLDEVVEEMVVTGASESSISNKTLITGEDWYNYFGQTYSFNDKGTSSTQLTFDEALKKLDKSGLRPGQTEISKSRVMEIVENYDPMKAQSSVYTDSTGRYLVEGHHTTVANTMLGKGSGVNMNIPTQQIPSATNVYWTKKWYEFWKTQIKVTK